MIKKGEYYNPWSNDNYNSNNREYNHYKHKNKKYNYNNMSYRKRYI